MDSLWSKLKKSALSLQWRNNMLDLNFKKNLDSFNKELKDIGEVAKKKYK